MGPQHVRFTVASTPNRASHCITISVDETDAKGGDDDDIDEHSVEVVGQSMEQTFSLSHLNSFTSDEEEDVSKLSKRVVLRMAEDAPLEVKYNVSEDCNTINSLQYYSNPC